MELIASTSVLTKYLDEFETICATALEYCEKITVLNDGLLASSYVIY